MDAKLLIDSIVRQTTILIAELATSAGIRAPLAHIANQTFFSLATELENSGLGQRVVADMFGLALRSYQQKIQRLSESATERGKTLWEVVFAYLQERKTATRLQILTRFRFDDENSVRGILNDLVESGFIYRTGRGASTLYGIVPDEDRERGAIDERNDSARLLAWLTIYRNSPIDSDSLGQIVPLKPETLAAAIEALLNDGRIREQIDNGVTQYASDSCLIPVGNSIGWDVALFDHFQAVVATICTKVRNGDTRSLPDDQIGGSTYTFDVWPGHPAEEQVASLLTRYREEVATLWNQVEAFNAENKSENRRNRQITFYLGQSVRDDP